MLKLVVLAALSLIFAPAAKSAPLMSNCRGNWADTIASLEPQPSGPMMLSAIHCLPVAHRGYPVSPSPDGSKIFSVHAIEGLWVGGVDPDDANHTFPGHAKLSVFTRHAPFEWLADSTEVIGVKDIMNDKGVVITRGQPYLFSNTGQQTPLPPLSHSNGTLREIYWMGGNGLAFATFTPSAESFSDTTISLVDAKVGRVLESVETATIQGLAAKRTLVAAASRIDGTGRAHVLATWTPDTWVLWDQGDRPRVVPIHSNAIRKNYALSVDGSKALIMGNLSATGWLCENGNRCPPPTPRSGMIAELREVSSGRLIWSLSGTAQTFSTSEVPAISPDGRYALITMPSDYDHIALVSMTDGTVLQRFRMPYWGALTLGFSPDAKQAWVTGGAVMAVFNIGLQH
ncbi:hypothetical protein AS026_13925 [Rhizobium altiplani]|uniref:Anaphase-promoting complex subunit 4 WD40 domain-containing protein n=1 Tax=Rhizobium altiplani TaxID=1864509 RepID=A0A109JDT4_9HYPH|nr:hypothetical protein [Rhizobium altiplani]KWV47063.1 hypothetical protein AS026_13925 [Rhizobium altiplani]